MRLTTVLVVGGLGRSGDARRNELLGRGTDHLIGKTEMNPARTGDHFDANQDHGNRSGHDP